MGISWVGKRGKEGGMDGISRVGKRERELVISFSVVILF